MQCRQSLEDLGSKGHVHGNVVVDQGQLGDSLFRSVRFIFLSVSARALQKSLNSFFRYGSRTPLNSTFVFPDPQQSCRASSGKCQGPFAVSSAPDRMPPVHLMLDKRGCEATQNGSGTIHQLFHSKSRQEYSLLPHYCAHSR